MSTIPPDSNDAPRRDDESEPSEEFARALKDFESSARPITRVDTAPLQVGSKVSGTVVAVTPDHVLLDIGARSEASADVAPFREEDGTLRVNVGDTLELFVVEANEAIVLAPSIKPQAGASLDRMREAKAAGMPVTGKVTAVNAGGLEVDLAGVRGFCPVSQIELGFCSDPSVYVGRSLEFLVTRLEEERKSVVLSRRDLLRRTEKDQAKQRLAALKVGDEVEGRVRRLEPFGAFVDIGGVYAMVHVSEIALTRIAHPKDVLHEGEMIRARVLRIESGKDGKPRIALSIKSLGPDPWTGIDQRYPLGSRVRGKVARLTDFGAFVTLEPGIDGLVHVSEIAGHRIEKPRDVLAPGQEVEAVVLSVDPLKKRVSLSIRRAAHDYVEEPQRPRPESRGRRPAAREGVAREGFTGEMPSPAPRGGGRESGRRGGGGGGGGRDGARDRDRERGRGERGRSEGRGGRRDRDRGGWRESAEGRPEQGSEHVASSQPPKPEEPTLMAIALRKALEKSRQREEQG